MGFAVDHGLRWSVAEQPTMNLKFVVYVRMALGGSVLRSIFGLNQRPQANTHRRQGDADNHLEKNQTLE